MCLASFSGIERCDIIILSILSLEYRLALAKVNHRLPPATRGTFMDDAWQRWMTVHGAYARPTRFNTHKPHILKVLREVRSIVCSDITITTLTQPGIQKVECAIREMANRRDTGGGGTIPLTLIPRQIRRLNEKLVKELVKLPNLVEYAEREPSISARAILLTMDEEPRLSALPRLG